MTWSSREWDSLQLRNNRFIFYSFPVPVILQLPLSYDDATDEKILQSRRFLAGATSVSSFFVALSVDFNMISRWLGSSSVWMFCIIVLIVSNGVVITSSQIEVNGVSRRYDESRRRKSCKFHGGRPCKSPSTSDLLIIFMRITLLFLLCLQIHV